MAIKGRIPVPKSQHEISNKFVEPYDKLNRGNPNYSSNEINRAEQVSFKNDTTKPFSLGIQDIDEAVAYYFSNVIKPSVAQNGQRIAVPIRYGDPERWKDAQRDGYYRDDKGKIMAPLITFKRNTITNDKVTSKIDANTPHNFEYFQKTYTKQNAYSKFNIQNNTKPVREAYAVVVPDFVTLNYNCIAYTYYVDQLNGIIESINYAANSYWGDPERFKFKALIDSFATITEVTSGENRNVRATFDLTLKGYLIPNVIQRDLVAPKKGITIAKVNILSEVVSDFPDVPLTTERYPDDAPPFSMAITTEDSSDTEITTEGGEVLLTEIQPW